MPLAQRPSLIPRSEWCFWYACRVEHAARPDLAEAASAMTERSGEDGAASLETRPYPGVPMAKPSGRTGATGTVELRTPRGWES